MCRRNDSLSPFSPARFSGRLLCSWLCIVLLLLPCLSYGSEPSKHLNSIEQSLIAIRTYSKKLEAELKDSQRISIEQQRNIEQLLSELRQLRTRLEASRSLLEKYKNRAGELLNSINELEKRLKALSESYEASEISWNEALQAAEKEIRIRKIRSVIMAIAALLAGVGLGYGMKTVMGGK